MSDTQNYGSPLENSGEISFPIEGKTQWPILMRTMSLGMFAGFGVVLAVFAGTGLIDDGALYQWILYLIFALVAAEYLLFLKVVIPMAGNYGRFRIYEHKVEYFPLTSTGMGVQPQSKSEPISKFKGVMVKSWQNKYSMSYVAVLYHPERGKSIRVRSFSSRKDAETFANILAENLNLNIVTEDQVRKKRRSL